MSLIIRSICSFALRFCKMAIQQPKVATSTENATTTSFSRLCPKTETFQTFMSAIKIIYYQDIILISK